MRTKYFTLYLLPSALRTYGRSSPATVHVIAPPFGASHLRSEFPGDSSCYCSSLRRFAPTGGGPRRQFMLLLLPSALRTYGRSSPATVHVIAPPFGASHLRSEFPGDSSCYCSSLRRFAPTGGGPRRQFMLLLLPSALRTYGRSSPATVHVIAPPFGASHLRSEFPGDSSCYCSSLRRFAPTGGGPRRQFMLLLLPSALRTYGRSSPATVHVIAPPFGASHLRSEFPGDSSCYCSSLRRFAPTGGGPRRQFMLLLLPSALRTYGRSSPATVHVIAPPFGASHLRSEFPGDSSCYCSSLRRFAPTGGGPRRQFMLLLLPSALRTYGRSSPATVHVIAPPFGASHLRSEFPGDSSCYCSSLRRFAPTGGGPRRQFMLLLLPSALRTYGRSSPATVHVIAPPFGASHLRSEFPGDSSCYCSSLRRFAPTGGGPRRQFMLLLLPSALRTYGRSSPATVHVIAPPFGASHLRAEVPGDSSCYCSSLRRFAPTVGVPRRQFMLLLLPSALRTYGRRSPATVHVIAPPFGASHLRSEFPGDSSCYCSSLRRFAPTVGVPRRQFMLLLLPSALRTYGRSSPATVHVI